MPTLPYQPYTSPFATVSKNTNLGLTNSFTQLAGAASLSLTSNLGIPQATQIITDKLNANQKSSYNTVPFVKLKKIKGVTYQDFRALKGWNVDFDSIGSAAQTSIQSGTFNALKEALQQTGGTALTKRIDGAAAASRISNRKKYISIAYAAASVSPAGAYSLFNRDANKNFGAGWGDHGNTLALRTDFTAQSHIATTWNRIAIGGGKWAPTRNLLSKATPFRGDRVQVIDFGQRNLRNIYEWKPNYSILGLNIPSIFDLTQDFIKFYLTGPKLKPAFKRRGGKKDDIIVFRAAISSLTDTFSPNWTPVNLIGRADANQQYTGYNRSLNLTFDVYATDRDEMKPIWRKLNALAGYTAPTYNTDSIALEAPWMRITIGDLFYQQPIIINSLVYTLSDNDTTWEINIEQDSSMMQTPKKISVTMGITLITNELPQNGGRFYTLAHRFDKNSNPKKGDDNWLSDVLDNEDAEPSEREIKKQEKQAERKSEKLSKQIEKREKKYNNKANKWIKKKGITSTPRIP